TLDTGTPWSSDDRTWWSAHAGTGPDQRRGLQQRGLVRRRLPGPRVRHGLRRRPVDQLGDVAPVLPERDLADPRRLRGPVTPDPRDGPSRSAGRLVRKGRVR